MNHKRSKPDQPKNAAARKLRGQNVPARTRRSPTHASKHVLTLEPHDLETGFARSSCSCGYIFGAPNEVKPVARHRDHLRTSAAEDRAGS